MKSVNYFETREIPAFGRKLTDREQECWDRIESNANLAGPWGRRIQLETGELKPWLFASNVKIYQDFYKNGCGVASITQKMICHYFAGKALWISSSLDFINSDGSCYIECLIDLDNKKGVISKDETKLLAKSLAESIGIRSLLYPSTNLTGYHIPFRIKLPYHESADYVWLVMGKLQTMLDTRVKLINPRLGVDVCGKPFSTIWQNGNLTGVRCSDNIVKLPDNMLDDSVFERWLTRTTLQFSEVEALVQDLLVNLTPETKAEEKQEEENKESGLPYTPPSPLVCLSDMNNSGTIETRTLNLLQQLWDLNPETERVYKEYAGKKLYLTKQKFVAYAYSWIAVAYSQDRMFQDKPDRRSTVGVMAVKGMFAKLAADWKVDLKHSMHDQTQVQRLLVKFGVLAMINAGYRVGGPEGGKARQIKYLRGCLESLVESGKKLDWTNAEAPILTNEGTLAEG